MSRVIGKLERLCYERHGRDLELARKKGGHPRGLKFDLAAGERVIAFVEGFCRHHKGEWARKPLLLEEWQKDVLRMLFGWKRADGTRRFRKAWIEIPRKNGKTELASALALYLAAFDGEHGAEVYCTGTTREQAKIAWSGAVAMVKHNPELARFLKPWRNTITCELLGSKLEPLSSDFGTLDGLSPHGDIRDEVHAWKDEGLASVLDTATGARRQPMTVEITTAGTYDRESVGWRHHDYAVRVLEGTFDDDRQFAFIAAIDEGDDPWDPAVWSKANPNLGVSLKADYIAEQAELAKRQPSFTNEFLRLHLNRWTQQVTRWLSMDRWSACPSEPINESMLEGRTCWGGLDLASKLDLTAFVLVFPNPDGSLTLLPRFWLPESTVDFQLKQGRAHYAQWVRDGWLQTTPGEVVDYEFIVAEIVELSQKYALREIAFDPWNASGISTQLGEHHGIQMVETRQGVKTLSEPAKNLEALIVSKKIHHGGNPVLAWMVGNAVVRRDVNGNIAPDKEKASDKIDGVVATIMAMSRVESTDDGYATRGFLSL
ncbi:MAG: terminase TerL endonuclease subunit [Nitrosomonas sp.]